MQVVDLFADDHDEAPSAQMAPAARAPEPAPGKAPKREPDLHHVIQHLHSGETFGALGSVINALSGVALLFFSFSGLWMYIQMWRNRAARKLKPGWFWK